MKRQRGHRRALARWHRRLGLVGAAFVLLLTISGWGLNHAEAFGLDRRFIGSDGLLDWYGIAPPGEPVSFAVAGDIVSQLGERLYLNGREIAGHSLRLIGAAALADLRVVAVGDRLMLFTPQGLLVETLGAEHGVPSGMHAVGVSGGRLAVRAAHGDYLAMDTGLQRWRKLQGQAVRWAEPAAIPLELRSRLVESWRGRGLTLERVLRDLHSGRLFGPFGPLVMDAAAAVFLVLTVMGLWIWWRQRTS
jgi:hypothetical protein